MLAGNWQTFSLENLGGKVAKLWHLFTNRLIILFYVDKASSDKLKIDSGQSHWFICVASHSTLAQVAPFLLFKTASLSSHTTAHKKKTTQRHVTRWGGGAWNTGAATAKSPAVSRQKNLTSRRRYEYTDKRRKEGKGARKNLERRGNIMEDGNTFCCRLKRHQLSHPNVNTLKLYIHKEINLDFPLQKSRSLISRIRKLHGP